MPSLRNPQFAAVNNSATGQTTLISNPSKTSFMYVWSLYVTVATATNLVFYNGNIALTGNMNFLAGSSFNPSGSGMDTIPLFTCDPNANLSVTSTAAAQQSGWIIYSN